MSGVKKLGIVLLLITEVLLMCQLFYPRFVNDRELISSMVAWQADNSPIVKARLDEATRRAHRNTQIVTGVTLGLLILNSWVLFRMLRQRH